MTATAQRARQLIERTGTHPVISLYLDLDPTRFATPPARASQVRSLLDEARRLSEPLALDHDGRATLEADLGRVEAELGSDDLPVSGARGLAVFCSGADDVYETVALTVPTASQVFVAPVAHVEPLVTAPNLGRWCAAVVSSDDAELLEGDGATITARSGSSTYVRGDNQSGDAQTHAREQDIEDHLLKVVAELESRLHRDRFELLALSQVRSRSSHGCSRCCMTISVPCSPAGWRWTRPPPPTLMWWWRSRSWPASAARPHGPTRSTRCAVV